MTKTAETWHLDRNGDRSRLTFENWGFYGGEQNRSSSRAESWTVTVDRGAEGRLRLYFDPEMDSYFGKASAHK